MPTLVLPPGDFAAYLFDCDGTLADTMPLHYRAWRATLDPLGCPFPEELFYSLGGTPTDGVVEFLNQRNGLALPPMETAVAKERRFLELIPEVGPVESVVAVARDAHARGLPMAVASGGFRRVVEEILTALAIRDWFGAVVGGDEVVNGKPAPDTYLEAARQLGVDPARLPGVRGHAHRPGRRRRGRDGGGVRPQRAGGGDGAARGRVTG